MKMRSPRRMVKMSAPAKQEARQWDQQRIGEERKEFESSRVVRGSRECRVRISRTGPKAARDRKGTRDCWSIVTSGRIGRLVENIIMRCME